MNNFTNISTKKINVSIFTQFYPPDYAATGQLIEELAQQLGDQGINLQIFTGQPGYAFQKQSAPQKEKTGQVLVQRSRTSRLWPQRIRGKAINGVLFSIRSILHLCKSIIKNIYLEKNEILLITTAPPFLPIIGYLVNFLCNVPYICLLYDLYPDVAVELKVLSEDHLLVRFWDFINCLVWQKATKIIVLSPLMRKRVIAKCPQVKDKIVVIHNWADPQRIIPIAKEQNWFAQEFNLVNKFTVLYSGNMGRCHDMNTILETAIILQNQPVEFVFIGNGAKKSEIMSKVQELGLTNCQFLPYQDKTNLPYSLTACDLSLVSVSEGMEGIVVPSKLYAALAAGRPIAVICESKSYLRHLIVNEAHCGAAFHNGDAQGLADFILNLAENKQIATEMGQAARKYLETNFTPEIIAKQYAQVFHQILNKNTPVAEGETMIKSGEKAEGETMIKSGEKIVVSEQISSKF
jgi:glycosyltransferase involved in cell wall biosynthesis